MKEWGIHRPELPKDKPIEFDIDWFIWFAGFEGKKRKGRSTLKKWVCPECDLKVRIGIKGNPELTYNPCGSVLVRADGLHHTIYQDDTQNEKNDTEMERE